MEFFQGRFLPYKLGIETPVNSPWTFSYYIILIRSQAVNAQKMKLLCLSLLHTGLVKKNPSSCDIFQP